MNVIGIESRATWTVAALREGRYPPRVVGDGRRSLIPNAVVPDLSWGSDAAADVRAKWPDADGGGPWLAPEAVGFWRRMHGRFVRFLGGVDLTEHDFRVVIAAPGAADKLRDLAALARRGGFEKVTTISPPEAAVAGWLSGQVGAEARESVVAAATVGDASVEVRAFAVRSGASPAILASSASRPLVGVGSGRWAARVVREVMDHLAKPLPEGVRLALWQAAMEYGDRLRRADPRIPVRWRGPWEERLMAPVRISAHDFASWEEVAPLVKWLPIALRDVARELGKPVPDVIILTGAGAAWPIPKAAFSHLPEPIESGDPALDVALGATWWPVFAGPASSPSPPPIKPPPARDSWAFQPRAVKVEPGTPPKPPAPPSHGGGAPQEWERLLERELGDNEG